MPSNPLLDPFSAAARPEITPGNRRVGVLLSHGFTGSPASIRPWAEFLAERGYAVEVPLLPGHGTTWQEMNETAWPEWYAAVESAFDKLMAENDTVVVGGLSMGAALTLSLAANRPGDVAGLVLVNPAVNSTDKRLIALPLIKRFIPSMPGIGDDIKKGGVEYCYERTPLKALSSLLQNWKPLRADLGKVTAPILMFRSRVDHVVDPSSGRIIAESVSSLSFTERILEDSFHVATLDNDAPEIFEESLAFIQKVTTT